MTGPHLRASPARPRRSGRAWSRGRCGCRSSRDQSTPARRRGWRPSRPRASPGSGRRRVPARLAVLPAVGTACAARVPARLEEHGVSVAGWNDDRTPAHEHVVHADDRGLLPCGFCALLKLLTTFRRARPGTTFRRSGPKLLGLRRDVAATGRRPEQVRVSPLQLLYRSLGHVLGHERVVVPTLVTLYGLLGGKLAHLPEPRLGPSLLRPLLGRPRQPVHVARRAVADHPYLDRQIHSFHNKW